MPRIKIEIEVKTVAEAERLLAHCKKIGLPVSSTTPMTKRDRSEVIDRILLLCDRSGHLPADIAQELGITANHARVTMYGLKRDGRLFRYPGNGYYVTPRLRKERGVRTKLNVNPGPGRPPTVPVPICQLAGCDKPCRRYKDYSWALTCSVEHGRRLRAERRSETMTDRKRQAR